MVATQYDALALRGLSTTTFRLTTKTISTRKMFLGSDKEETRTGMHHRLVPGLIVVVMFSMDLSVMFY